MKQLELFDQFESKEAQKFEQERGNLIFYPAAFGLTVKNSGIQYCCDKRKVTGK